MFDDLLADLDVRRQRGEEQNTGEEVVPCLERRRWSLPSSAVARKGRQLAKKRDASEGSPHAVDVLQTSREHAVDDLGKRRERSVAHVESSIAKRLEGGERWADEVDIHALVAEEFCSSKRGQWWSYTVGGDSSRE